MEDSKSNKSQVKIQETFLEQRKVFLWGEVSDKSARDVTEKLLYLEFKDPGQANHFLHQYTRRIYHCRHGHIRYHAVDILTY